MPKTTKLKSLKQTTGQLVKNTDKIAAANETVPKFRSLDELFGGGNASKYKTLDFSTYSAQLENMNTSELQDHARTIGLVPIDDHKRLRKTLLEEFKSFAKSYAPVAEIKNLRPQDISEDVRKILAEGR